jgi:hypothetical protein
MHGVLVPDAHTGFSRHPDTHRRRRRGRADADRLADADAGRRVAHTDANRRVEPAADGDEHPDPVEHCNGLEHPDVHAHEYCDVHADEYPDEHSHVHRNARAYEHAITDKHTGHTNTLPGQL